MAITAHAFPQFQQKALSEAVNLTSDTVKMLLLTAYTYSDAHVTLADVLAAGTELGTSATGYSAGGLTVSGMSVSTTAKVTTVTATSPQLVVPLSGSAAFAYIVWCDTQGGANTTRYPFAYWDLGGTMTFNNTSGGTETVTITVPAGGICTFTAS